MFSNRLILFTCFRVSISRGLHFQLFKFKPFQGFYVIKVRRTLILITSGETGGKKTEPNKIPEGGSTCYYYNLKQSLNRKS